MSYVALWAAGVLSIGAAVLLPVTAAPAAAPPALFEEIGTLDRFGDDARAAAGAQFVPTWEQATVVTRDRGGTIFVFPKVRQLWQVYALDGTPRTKIVVRDLDTLEISRTITLEDGLDRGSPAANEGGDWSHTLDNTGTRLFLLSQSHHHVYDFDLRTFAVKRWPVPTNALLLGFPFVTGGLAYDPYHDDLIVLYGGPPAGQVANVNTLIYRLDVSGVPAQTFPRSELEKMYRLRSCTGPVTSTDAGDETYNWDMLVTKDHLYVPCQRLGHTVIVVRLARPSGNDPDHPEDVAAGPVYGETVMADQGSGRLFVTTTRREIWAFETSTMSFIGVVATGPENSDRPTGYGVDPETGRVFFQSPSFGLGVAEGRFFPLPQARTDTQRKASGQERIWSDAATGRVFVLEGEGSSHTKPRAYKIYRTGPAPRPPSPPDPDRNTADVPERDGMTEARYNGSASGYGTRILWAKGYATVLPAPTLGVLAPTADFFKTAFQSRCGFTDRDVFVGRVSKSEYDTGSTAAAAIAADVDTATRQDLNKPSRCQINIPDEDRWTYDPAACATSQGDDTKAGHGGGDGIVKKFGSSTVSCPKPGGKLEAHAESTLTGMVEVDRSWTTTTVERTTAGVRSTVESVAEGVTLGEVFSIGRIRSKATSTSNGRPVRGEMSTHEIEIQHVRFGDTMLCEAKCDPVQLERDLNVLAGGRAVFRTGHGTNSGRDEVLVEGSPRGAQTAVQKSVARQASDRALVGDFTVEVPAFEMTVFNDNTSWGRARQVYQFAGVASSATYNIVLRPTLGGDVPEGPGDLPGEPSIADGGSTPFTPSVESVGQRGSDFSMPITPAGRQGEAADGRGDGGLAGLVRAVVRGIRLFLSDPRHALLLITAWALLASPAVLSRRRRLLAQVAD